MSAAPPPGPKVYGIMWSMSLWVLCDSIARQHPAHVPMYPPPRRTKSLTFSRPSASSVSASPPDQPPGMTSTSAPSSAPFLTDAPSTGMDSMSFAHVVICNHLNAPTLRAPEPTKTATRRGFAASAAREFPRTANTAANATRIFFILFTLPSQFVKTPYSTIFIRESHPNFTRQKPLVFPPHP